MTACLACAADSAPDAWVRGYASARGDEAISRTTASVGPRFEPALCAEHAASLKAHYDPIAALIAKARAELSALSKEEQLRAAIEQLGALLIEECPEKLGFLLILAPSGEEIDGHAYASNIAVESCRHLARELLARLDEPS